MSGESIRKRFEDSLAGKEVRHPVYAVYDWFVDNRRIDWQSLFDLGLGRINHAPLTKTTRPKVEVRETVKTVNGEKRRDVTWITAKGELHEWYLGEWRQEYLIEEPEDYRIMFEALSGSSYEPDGRVFEESETALGDSGITLGGMGRTPLQEIQIDLAGLETFSIHLALGCPELMELIELMNDLKTKELAAAVQTPAENIKLWENLTIETMGPMHYRRHLVPVYHRMFEIAKKAGKKILVHYDGKLKAISADIARLPFQGLDSLTPPPEGDMSIAECRSAWPDKYLWLHPTLDWFRLSEKELRAEIRRMTNDAGPRNYCLMISEEVPPDWPNTVPAVLNELDGGV